MRHIQNEFEGIKEKVSKRTTVHVTVSSPATLGKLKEISVRLAKIEQDIKIIGLIGNVTLQNQSNSIDMHNVQQSLSKISAQLEALSVDPQSAREIIMELIQAQCDEMTIGADTSHRRENRRIESVDPADKLTTGIM